MTPEQVEALIEKKVSEQLKPMEEKLDSILKLLAKFEGAGTVMKLLFLGIAPVITGIVWLKDHVKL
jgi:hypothetical protein